MKKALYSAIAILLSFYSISQTFWTEAFENNCTANCSAIGVNTGNGPWTVTNNSPAVDGCGYPTSPNAWYVSCAENGNAAGVCGVGCGSDESLHMGSTTVGDLGAAYDAGGWCDFGLGGWGDGTPTDKRAESPTINCTAYSNITLAFNYIENGEGTLDDATLWWYNGTVWAQLFNLAKTTLCGGQGMWTAYSIILPAGANNNPNVKIGFRWVNDDNGMGTDPSFAVDDITLSVIAVSNSITTGTITGSPFCACASVNVPFTSTGTFTAGNTYTAQLSNASGSFAAPVTIGTLSSTANSGTISCVIPCNTASGTLYRIRVISSAPSVTGTDNGVDLVINAAPTTPVIGTITQPTCSVSTGSVALSSLPSSGTWTVTASPGGATSTGTGTTTTFSGLSAGTTYTFTVTNSNGCTSSASANAVINAAPTTPTAPVIGTITQPTCSTSTGSVALSGLPASGTWTVTASPGGTTTTGTGTTTTFSGLTAGATYTFTVTNASGCTSTASANAIINTAPTPATAPIVGTITQPTCSTSTGSVALSGLPASGTWTVTANPGGTTTTGTGTTTTFSGLTAGTTYTFTVTNSSGCTSVASGNAIINAAPTTPTAPVVGTITQPTCSTPTGSVALSGLPSSGSWTITASPGGTTSTGTGTTTTFSGLVAGATFTFTVTNASGCTSSASGNAIINAAPTNPTAPIIGTITQPTCSTPTGTVDLSGLPASGTWTVTASPGGSTATGTGTSTTFTGLTAGTTFTFTVTNASGCTSSASANAVITSSPGSPTAPVIGTITQPTCSVSTGSVDLSGLPSSGTWTLTVSPGGTTSTGTGTTTTFTGLTAGTTYTFTVTNASGCISGASSNVVINSAPTTPTAPVIGTITQPTCTVTTGSVALSGLPSSGTWTITALPGSSVATGTGTTTTFTGLTAGNTYTFTVTNASGCVSPASSNAVINAVPSAPSAPTASVTTQPTCVSPTGTITVTAPTGANIQYSIGGAYQASGVFSGLTANTYNVTAQDISTGCISTATSLTVNPAPGAPASPTASVTPQPTCSTPTGTIVITAPTGANIQYSVGGPYQASGTFSGLIPGSYNVTAQDISSGCISSATVLTVNPIPTAPAAPTASVTSQPTCSTPTGTIVITAPTGANIQYSVGGAYQASGTFSGLSPNTYGITAQDVSTGCISSITNVTVNSVPSPPPAPTASVSVQPTCSIPTGTIDITAPAGANIQYSIGGTYQTSGTFTGLVPNNYNVTAQDITTGCISTATVVTVNSAAGAPVITVTSQTDVSCYGENDGNASISVSGGVLPYTYGWTPSGGSSDIATNLVAGTYTVTVTDDDGCISTEDIVIGTPSEIIIGGIETNVQCGVAAGSITTNVIGGTGIYTFDWNDSSTGTSLTGLSAGNYSVIVTDDSGCSATESYSIINSGSLTINVTPSSTSINAGESVQLTASGGTSYSWTPSTGLSCNDCPDPVASPSITTIYSVDATDSFGCSGSTSALVTVIIDCGEVFVPTIFSPNNDLNNDKLEVFGFLYCVQSYHFTVYDRWGELVFDTSIPSEFWDGTYKGKLMNSGTYFYKIEATMTDATEVILSGNTTLVR